MPPAPLHQLVIHLHPQDSVAVARRALSAGIELEDGSVRLTVRQAIPPGHKVALVGVRAGQPVRKYGQIIGFASAPIEPGDHVHTHNLVAGEFTRDYQFGTECRALELYPPDQMRYFQGYLRPDGRVGTRNYVAVISSVNCSASVARYVAEAFRSPELQRDFPQVDGVIAFTHKTGCGLQPTEPLQLLERVLAGLVRHPNVGASVLIGLGCEVAQIDELVRVYGLDQGSAGMCGPVCLSIQQLGGVQATVQAGVAAVRRLLPVVNAARRSPQPISKLVLAENCGGSDAYSGITANPALGVASDELVRFGGTSVLAETPEIYGAEHLLIRRAVNRQVGEALLERIRWWEQHVRLHGASIDNNPSVGNKAGGLTTIYEKSLGAIAKAGQAPLMAVYRYAEPVVGPGLCFMDTPGLDPVSMTGLVAGGCNIAVFTTGRGSVYGCKPTPCIKVASNTPLFQQMQPDMDLNAGTVLDGTETVQQVGQRIFELMIAVASGQRTRSELAGIGDEEFAPWILGPTF
jgi:altronate hydrolase